MVRVKLTAPEELGERDRAAFERASSYGQFDGLLRTMATRPPILRHTFDLLLELRTEEVLPRRYLELALVTVSRLNECTYCVSHHAPRAKMIGFSDEALASILDCENHPEFTEADRAVVAFSKMVTERANRVPDKVVDRLRPHFDDAQITELTWRVALCGAFNRFNDVLQTAIEPEVAVLDASAGPAAAQP
jgi:uncharacterized peroxidase-related enzyme